VIALDAATASRWAALPGLPPAQPEDPAALRAVLERGPLAPLLLLVGVRQGTPEARFAATLRPARHVTFEAPEFAAAVRARLRMRYGERFLRMLVDLAAEKGVTYLETRRPLAAASRWWAELLGRCGFRAAASARLFSRELVDRPGASPRREAIVNVTGVDERELVALMQIVRSDSRDRGDDTRLISARDKLEVLRTVPGVVYDPRLWFVLPSSDGLDGYVFCATDRSGRVGWILELGVHPQKRNQGIGSAMVCHGLLALHERGCATAFALIDDHNIPSQRVHAGNGFAGTNRRYELHRYVMAGAEHIA
jgi:ribosomal protein S18 acetylase RimI-like enzyme